MTTKAEKHMSCPPRMGDLICETISPPPHQQQQQQQQQQPQKSNGLYKTELCHSFEETSHCKYGDKCKFAHGRHELRRVSRHPKYKTDLCKTFHTVGTCPYGTRCHFIHNLDEAPAILMTDVSSLNEQEDIHPGNNNTIDLLKGNRNLNTISSNSSNNTSYSNIPLVTDQPELCGLPDPAAPPVGGISSETTPEFPRIGRWVPNCESKISHREDYYEYFTTASGEALMDGAYSPTHSNLGEHHRYSVPLYAEATFGGSRRYSLNNNNHNHPEPTILSSQPEIEPNPSISPSSFPIPLAASKPPFGRAGLMMHAPPSDSPNRADSHHHTAPYLKSTEPFSPRSFSKDLSSIMFEEGPVPHEPSAPIPILSSATMPSRSSLSSNGSAGCYAGALARGSSPAVASFVDSSPGSHGASSGGVERLIVGPVSYAAVAHGNVDTQARSSLLAHHPDQKDSSFHSHPFPSPALLSQMSSSATVAAINTHSSTSSSSNAINSIDDRDLLAEDDDPNSKKRLPFFATLAGNH
eukprot:Sdes_comp17117_c0_seq1m6280